MVRRYLLPPSLGPGWSWGGRRSEEGGVILTPAVDPDLHGELSRHAEEVALEGLLHQALLLL